MKIASKIFLLIGCLLFWLNAGAQSTIPVLERKITVDLDHVSLETALNIIAIQGSFTFSYNTDLIDKQKKISVDVVNKPVREVLDILFKDKLQYQVKGKHLILTKKEAEDAPSYLLLSGYVTDGKTGEKIPSTSIYDKISRVSVITNIYGYYSFKLNKKKISGNKIALYINKQNYNDTIVYISQKGNTTLNITIYPSPEDEKKISEIETQPNDTTDDFNESAWLKLILNDLEKANAKNIRDTLFRKFQFSLVPYAGTNLALGGNTINDYSINTLIGYSMGTRKLELAGLINIDRSDVSKVQLAGLGNLVGGSVKGVQVAGLFNCNYQETNGVQMAGLLNVNRGNVHVAQCAGLLNVNLNKTYAVQAAGLINVSLDSMEGVQAAGLVNFALKKINGTQVAGLINYARNVQGAQLGFLNISDTCNGIPIGFLSFVNKGYHQLEISGDEVFPVNVSLRTGVKRFYTLLTAGMQLENTDTITWSFGYGLGTSVQISKKWSTCFDFTVNQVMVGNRINNFNPLGKVSVMVERKLTRKIAIALGPVLNMHWVNITDPDYQLQLKELAPYSFYKETRKDNYESTFWVGGKLALRFF